MSVEPPSRRDGLSLTGWLYADLLLALAMIFLAASAGGLASPNSSGGLVQQSPAPNSSGTTRSPDASPLAAPSPWPSKTVGALPSPTASLAANLTPEPSAAASPVLAERPSPTPAEETCEPSVNLKRTAVLVGPGGSGAPPTVTQLERAFRRYRDRTAGLIQAYGFTPPSRPDNGKDYAQVAIDRLRRAVPEMFTPETVTETYHNLRLTQTGRVQFAVYFLEQSCH